jgi:murein DD-endopeptidase MepM/ murein hydrolase activator NlpD
MNTKTVLGLAATLAAVGCASNPSPAPISYGGRPAPPAPTAAAPRPAPVQSAGAYTYAPAAPVASTLRLCPGRVSNAGLVNASNETLNWTPYLQTDAGQLLRNPTESACLSSGYGHRNIANGGPRQHSGIDLANAAGGFIYAAGAGRVLSAGPRGLLGLAIELDHGDGVRTLYGHLDDINPLVQPGVWAAAGAAIGRMGRTGNATGVHLHYEVQIDGMKIDPLNFGAPNPAPQAPAFDAWTPPALAGWGAEPQPGGSTAAY